MHCTPFKSNIDELIQARCYRPHIELVEARCYQSRIELVEASWDNRLGRLASYKKDSDAWHAARSRDPYI